MEMKIQNFMEHEETQKSQKVNKISHVQNAKKRHHLFANYSKRLIARQMSKSKDFFALFNLTSPEKAKQSLTTLKKVSKKIQLTEGYSHFQKQSNQMSSHKNLSERKPPSHQLYPLTQDMISSKKFKVIFDRKKDNFCLDHQPSLIASLKAPKRIPTSLKYSFSKFKKKQIVPDKKIKTKRELKLNLLKRLPNTIQFSKTSHKLIFFR